MWSPEPIELTMASESGSTGSPSTRWFQGLSAGNTGQPASTAAPIATLPYKSAQIAAGARLALRQLPVAANVAVLAAGDHIERGLVAHIFDLPHGGGIHAREAARAELVLGVVVHADRDPAAVHEVELLLLLVEVAPGLEARRDLDRVDAEGGDAQDAADLPKARPLGQRVDVRDGIAVALHQFADLVSHARQRKRLCGSLGAPEAAARPQKRDGD